MVGDFNSRQSEFEQFLKDNGISPEMSAKAIDLGAGHGIQSISLAKVGFNVLAVDFNDQLLIELIINARDLPIETRNEDIKGIKRFSTGNYNLVVCCGDTLSHLDNKKEVENLLNDMCEILDTGGKVLLSFRDYSTELTADNRFIPVKSDDSRILTCILDYEEEKVKVTDLLYERTQAGWKQKVSSYYKVKTVTNEIIKILEASGMQIQLNQVINRMTTILAVKVKASSVIL